MHEEIVLSPQGRQKLENELDDLKKNRRRQVAERIGLAKEFGDLSENAEYHEAKEEQAFIEGRILELEMMLKNAQVVTKNGTDKVEVGSQVTLKIDGKIIEYTIVGASETDPKAGKISVDSPLGNSLMGKAKNEKVEIMTPQGKMTCEIIEIK